MKKINIIKSLLLFFTLPAPLLAPPIQQIKGLSSLVKPEYQHLSPVNAMIALETDQLKRLLQTGDPQKPSTQLLGNLFKIQDNRLYPQNNLSKPAAHFNPEIIADLVAMLEKRTLVTPNAETQSTLRGKINQELKKKSKGHMTTKKLGAFLETLKQADIECKQITTGSIPALPYTALLGYFCLKYKPVDDFCSFFQHLQRNDIAMLTTADPHTMLKDHFTLENRQHFEKQVQQTASKRSPSEIVKMLKEDRTFYETALFTEIDTTYYRGSLPPMAAESDVVFDGIHMRDCVNTALRTFFDHLFYDPETFCFDPLKKLPPGFKPCHELLDFYQTYSHPSDVNGSPTIARDWMEILANRPGVIYHCVDKDRRIEVCARGGIPNIILILNQLFNLKDKTCEELCKLLSTKQRTLSSSYIHKKEDRESLHITFKNIGESSYRLSLELMHEHGFMKRSSHITTSSPDGYHPIIRHTLLSSLASDGYDQDTHNLLSVYLSQDHADLRKDIQQFVANQAIPYPNLIDFYSMIDYDVGNNDLIIFESACSFLKEYPQLKYLLLALIFDLDDKDASYYYYNIKYLAKYNAWETCKELADTIIKLLEKIQDKTYLKKTVGILEKYKADNVPALKKAIQKNKA